MLQWRQNLQILQDHHNNYLNLLQQSDNSTILTLQRKTGTAISRFEQFTVINNIAPDRQVACLLAVMGPTTYGVLRNLVYPDKPKGKTLQEISTILEGRYTEKKMEIAERFRFYTAIQ